METGEFPIVALWSHPRSMSTAIERVMRELGDFRCFHEPFMYFYYAQVKGKRFLYFEPDASHPVHYDEIRRMLLDAATRSPVFFKDMSYYIVSRMHEDKKFAKRLLNTFLIRDPAKSILSYYKLDPDFSSDEVGLERQWEHFELLKNWFDETPVVIDATDVLTNPDGLLRAYCQRIGVSFIEDALSWNAEVPEDWKDVSTWHKGAIASGGLRPAKTNDDSENAAGVSSLYETAPHLQKYYEHHAVFYNKLREHRITPPSA